MKRFPILACVLAPALAVAAPTAVSAQDGFEVVVEGDSVRFTLPDAMAAALAARYPGFRLFHPADFVGWGRRDDDGTPRPLSVAVAELNGDGVEDVALSGALGDTALVIVALLSDGDGGREAVEVLRTRAMGPVGLGTGVSMSTYITPAGPGRYEASCRDVDGPRALELEGEGLMVIIMDRSRSVYHYRDGAFTEFIWRGC